MTRVTNPNRMSRTALLILLLTVLWMTCSSIESVTPLIIGSNSISHDKQVKFDPYVDNGGTVIAIAGENFVAIGADTRLPEGYVIRSRRWSRLSKLSSGLLLGATGCASDFSELTRLLTLIARKYEMENNGAMTTSVMAMRLSNALYSRRQLPYYSFCVLAGLSANGCGKLYHYDPLGSMEEVRACCLGRGEKMIQPILDEVLEQAGMRDDDTWQFDEISTRFVSPALSKPLRISQKTAVNLITGCFRAAAEREISLGDGFQVMILQRSPVDGQIILNDDFISLPPH